MHKEEILRKQKLIIYIIALNLVIILVFSFLLYRQFAAKKKANILLNLKNEEISAQRDEIEAQRDLVHTQKNRIEEIYCEVSESIRYAKRIQSSALPGQIIMRNNFSDHFVFFKPCHEVSGDFYWWGDVAGQIVVAAADCTGHGVPGAFMSMLGMSLLKEIVINKKTTRANQILQKLRNEIIIALKQTSYEERDSEQCTGSEASYNRATGVKDGMDMSLVVIDNKTKHCQFAGANNPLYLICKGDIEDETYEKKLVLKYNRHTEFCALFLYKPP